MPEATYNSHFEVKKSDIGPGNNYFWNDYPEIFNR
jgi:hypothetical protein